MARREWADKLAVKKYGNKGWHLPYAEGLKFEHARAGRIRKAQLKAAQLDQHTWLKNERDGYLSACRDILAMLTKGRA